jgi:methylated-DNA-[protein]-cysteine S-methyltransferase
MDTGQTNDMNQVSVLAARAAAPDSDPCDVALDAMPGYVVGDLKQPDQHWLHQHTGSCNYCRRELASFEKLDDLLDHISLAHFDAPPISLSRNGAVRLQARYGIVASPVGDLLVAVSEGGVCEIAFARKGSEGFFEELRRRGFDAVADQDAVASVAAQLRDYFEGRRSSFDVSVDLSGVSPFTQQVLRATAHTPFGQLRTYRDIAREIGKPGATRAVGNALGKNPIAIVVPCHRIIRSDRTIGGYTGGLDIKRTLLSIEGSSIPSGPPSE